MTDTMFRWDKDADGVVTLTMDAPDAPVNTMNDTFREGLVATVERLEAELAEDPGSIRGVIITSAKKTFFAGADLTEMIQAGPGDAAAMFGMVQGMKDALRRLERAAVPVVAAINGSALGGGLEIALAANHRIAADARGSKIGLPEVTLGLLPGAGGIVRTVRMLGIQDALMKVLLPGTQMRPAQALEAGLVDEVVEPGELLDRARAWVTSEAATATQPWDEKGYKIPGGTPTSPKLAMMLPSFPANLTKQLKGAPMLSPKRAMQAAIEGAQVDFDTALTIESRYFTELACGTQSKNMVQAFFFDLQHCNGGGSRPRRADGTPFPTTEFRKVAVVGAGMMGAGIAYVCAKVGMEVVLKDVTLENAERGKNYSEKLEAKALSRGRTTEEKSRALLDRIHPTDSYEDLRDVDIVVEAVFENTELKHRVHAEIEAAVPDTAVLGSNTSTLPITELGEAVERTGDFIGLHFFSPVDKMMLIEIISGENTSPETLAKALDFSVQIRKVPIVVNDSRGFYTSRVIATVINESMRMVAEGHQPTLVEAAGRQAGYPAAQLQLADELNLKLMKKVREETEAAMRAAGQEIEDGGVAELVDRMLAEFDRPGRLEGRGFYEYVDGKRTRLWPGLWSELGAGSIPAEETDLQDLVDRMLFIEAIETQRCIDEGVVVEDADANIGSIFGIGYPAWTGGTRQFIVNYDRFSGRPEAAKAAGVVDGALPDGTPTLGVPGFVARAEELAAAHGGRFTPPASLRG